MADVSAMLTQGGDVVRLGNQDFRRKPRWYTVVIPRTATASALASGFIQIDPNPAPFLLNSIHISDSSDGNLLTTQEEFSISAQDNENGYLWADGYVPRSGFAGDRIFGYVFPNPVAVRANTRVTFSIQNRVSGAVIGNATISFRGWTLIPM